MHLFRQPPERRVLDLLEASGLPAADLTPQHLVHFFGCGLEHSPQGVVGVEIYGTDALLRSLAVAQIARGRGCGKALVAAVEEYACKLGARRVYLLTTTAARFFEKLGYRPVSRDEVPLSIRATAQFASLCPSSAATMAKDLGTARCAPGVRSG